MAVSLDQLLLLPQVPVGDCPLSVGPVHCVRMYANKVTNRRKLVEIQIAFVLLFFLLW